MKTREVVVEKKHNWLERYWNTQNFLYRKYRDSYLMFYEVYLVSGDDFFTFIFPTGMNIEYDMPKDEVLKLQQNFSFIGFSTPASCDYKNKTTFSRYLSEDGIYHMRNGEFSDKDESLRKFASDSKKGDLKFQFCEDGDYTTLTIDTKGDSATGKALSNNLDDEYNEAMQEIADYVYSTDRNPTKRKTKCRKLFQRYEGRMPEEEYLATHGRFYTEWGVKRFGATNLFAGVSKVKSREDFEGVFGTSNFAHFYGDR